MSYRDDPESLTEAFLSERLLEYYSLRLEMASEEEGKAADRTGIGLKLHTHHPAFRAHFIEELVNQRKSRALCFSFFASFHMSLPSAVWHLRPKK